MSCKYCNNEEPLIQEDYATICINGPKIHKQAKLSLNIGDVLLTTNIYYCPICGDELRPFGPAWSHNLD